MILHDGIKIDKFGVLINPDSTLWSQEEYQRRSTFSPLPSMLYPLGNTTSARRKSCTVILPPFCAWHGHIMKGWLNA